MTSSSSDTSPLERALTFLSLGGASGDVSSLVLRLKKALPEIDSAVLSLAAEVFTARTLAPSKLGEWAKEGFFSLSVLQQASRAVVAAHRARYFAGAHHVLEIGTGSGCDTAALARVVGQVTTIDVDATTSELARRNMELLGLTNVTFLVGDVRTVLDGRVGGFDGLFADPARRSKEGERVKESEEYSPPLSWVMELPVVGVRAIKVSPGLFVEPPPIGWSRQFVGVGAECLEQTLWYGTDVTDSSVVLADRGIEWAPGAGDCTLADADTLTGWICEAHAVVNRSQHLRQFFAERGIRVIAPDVAYGIAPELPEPSPFVDRFKIVGDLPFHAKKVKTRLTELGWSNRTEFKKRAVSVDPEQFRRDISLPEHSHNAPFGVVFIFPWQGKPWVVVAERIRD